MSWLSAAAGLLFILLSVVVWAALKDEHKPYLWTGVFVFAFWGSYTFIVSIGLWEYYPPLTSSMLYLSVGWLIAHFGKLLMEGGDY